MRACRKSRRGPTSFVQASSSTSWHWKKSQLLKSKIPFRNSSSITDFTERLGTLLGLTAQSRVLDIASGNGTSALFLTERFGCEILGIDYSEQSVEQANAAAAAKGLDNRVSFRTGDAERLPVAESSFDAIICECAFCTFPDKLTAVNEFARVLRSGGSIGFGDLNLGSVFPNSV